MSDDITADYHGGNARSIEAHEATTPNKNADYARILAVLRKRPTLGLTCDEAERILGMKHQTCSARFSDMKKKGWLITTGTKRKTRSGCNADVHFATKGETS